MRELAWALRIRAMRPQSTLPPRFRATALLLTLSFAISCATTGTPARPADTRPAAAASTARPGITNPVAQLVSSPDGVAASATTQATEVGARVLAEGGTAVDAAVAIGFALAVTEPSMSGLGGRASVILRHPDGRIIGIDGLNQVPNSYKEKSGLPDPYERAAIPGVPAALGELLATHGTWPLARVLAPAIALAENGFILGEGEAARWAAAREELAKFGAGVGTYLKPDGSLWKAGERPTNPLLAATLRRLAAEGIDSFYRGSIAADIDVDMAARGAFLRKEELAAYRAQPAILVTGTYRGHTLTSNFRPAAGHAVIQALQTMEGLAVPGPTEPARWASVIGQAMHHALTDRGTRRGTEAESAAWLTSIDHARERATKIVMPPRTEVSTPPPAREDFSAVVAGTLVMAPTDREATTHYAVADRQGRVVSLTQSLGPAMGTRLVAPKLGFMYATRLGTVPGSRPASTIAPTLVQPPGGGVIALGGAGDSRIISAVIQVISRMVDHKMSLAEAMAAPRVHPDDAKTMRIEEGPAVSWPEGDRAKLAAWHPGLVGAPSGYFGRVHAVWVPPSGPAVASAETRWTGGAAAPIR